MWKTWTRKQLNIWHIWGKVFLMDRCLSLFADPHSAEYQSGSKSSHNPHLWALLLRALWMGRKAWFYLPTTVAYSALLFPVQNIFFWCFYKYKFQISNTDSFCIDVLYRCHLTRINVFTGIQQKDTVNIDLC